MDSNVLVDAALTDALWVVGGGAIGVIVASATIVFMAQRRPIPAGVAAMARWSHSRPQASRGAAVHRRPRS